MSKCLPLVRLTDKLSGLKVEYALALIHASQAGKREAVLQFDANQGSKDLGFRGEVPVLFDIRPAVPVRLLLSDADGTPTTGRFTFKDKSGRVYPPKAKRLAPDFFFQDQVYRHQRGHGASAARRTDDALWTWAGILAAGTQDYRPSQRRSGRYKGRAQALGQPDELWLLQRRPSYSCGRLHHYTSPTEGVFAEDMFLHVKGEGLNVGCNLTWGPCYDFQRQFFEPTANKVSEPLTVLKYDVEVSGFGSQALGPCLPAQFARPNLSGLGGYQDQRLADLDDAVDALGQESRRLHRLCALRDRADFRRQGKRRPRPCQTHRRRAGRQQGRSVSRDGSRQRACLPDAFAKIDANKDGLITEQELVSHVQGIWNTQLPNLAIPPMDGIGAQEICVTCARVCATSSAPWTRPASRNGIAGTTS